MGFDLVQHNALVKNALITSQLKKLNCLLAKGRIIKTCS